MWNRHSTSANLCSGQSQEIDSSDYQLTETQSHSDLKLSTLRYTFMHTLFFPFLIVIQTKEYLSLNHFCFIYVHCCPLLINTIRLNRVQSADQMSAAQGQRQASAEQDADPQIAIHYQYDTWLMPKEKLCTTWFLWAWYWKRSHVTKTFDLVPCFFFSKFYIACESVQTFFQVIYFWETFFGSFWRRGELFWLF